MARFPDKFEVETSLQTLLSRVACNILSQVAGEAAAIRFLGISAAADQPRTLSSLRIGEIDPKHFEIWTVLERAHEGLLKGWFDGDDIESLNLSLEDFLFALRFKVRLLLDSPDQWACVRIAEAARGFLKILDAVVGRSSEDLSVFELACLANLTQRSVFSALSKNESGLAETRLVNGSAGVSPRHALRWLVEKRKFRRARVSQKRLFKNLISELTPRDTGRSPAGYCEIALDDLALAIFWNAGSPKQVAEKLGWSIEAVEDCLRGALPEDETRLRALADLIAADPEIFVPAAHRIREFLRDASREKGVQK